MNAASASVLTTAPRDLAAWVALFQPEALPVLAETAATIEDWREHQDEVDAHTLGETISNDPLMTLKLFAHLARVSRHGHRSDLRSDVETVTGAIVMLGISPFFRAFGPQAVAEEWLAPHAGALEGFQAVLRRSNRAAAFAIHFAVHRMDHDAAVLYEAAMLYDFAELLMWLKAPALATEIRQRQTADPALRSLDIQRELLNVSLPELQHRLMMDWRLPDLLVHCTDDQRAKDLQVRNVILAIRVARHSALGWDNPALPDDIRDVAEMLQLGIEPARRLLMDIDAGA